MIRKLPGFAVLLAGLGLCVGCTNMPVGNGQIWNRMTGRSCGETCPSCECPCSGTCGYGMEVPGVLTSGGPSLPVQMGPAISTDMPNIISSPAGAPLIQQGPPSFQPTPPLIQQAQPMPAQPQSLIKR